jgi:hypothetical protein
MKNDPIQDYILKSERNLRIAAAVGEAWPGVREKLGSDFLNRLEARLMKRFRGWESYRYKRFLVDDWPGYVFWKPAWRDQYSICLQYDNYGEKISFGVGRDGDRQRPSPELLEAVRKLHPSAKSHPEWEARVTMRSPETDWRKPEVLWRIRTDASFLAEVAEQLVEVAKVSEPIIDRLVRKK